MSALGEYTNWRETVFAFRQPSVKLFQTFSRADAANAELEDENERLRKLLKSAEVINNQQYDRAEQAIEAARHYRRKFEQAEAEAEDYERRLDDD